ncbi:MAG: helix-turn-helix domain-containing protein [Spirochaetia bacterium]
MNGTTAQIGRKLRGIRERKGLTLRNLAEMTSLSESLLSQIERGKVSPSLDSLMGITGALEIDPEYLFRDLKRNKTVSVIRADRRNSRTIEGVDYEQLSVIWDGTSDHLSEALLLEIPPGMEKRSPDYGHGGTELGFILEGSGSFTYGTETYELEAGDSISFAADLPHALNNRGTKPLKALWVLTPPRMFYTAG